MSLQELLNQADVDDEDDEDDDDFDGVEGDSDEGDSDDEPSALDQEQDGLGAPPGDDDTAIHAQMWTEARLHSMAHKGDAAGLAEALELGRKVAVLEPHRLASKLDRVDGSGATALVAALIAGAVRAALKAHPEDPWAPEAAANVEQLLSPPSSWLERPHGEPQPAESVPQLECVRLLLAAGASTSRAYFGRTPLHLVAGMAALASAASFATAAAKALIDSGADPLSVDGEGATPLHYAAAACDLKTRNGTRRTPPALSLVELLLASRADPGELLRARDVAGRTPLHRAVALGGLGVAGVALVEAGAKDDQADFEGMTAWHLAKLAPCAESQIKLADSPQSAPDAYGRTSFDAPDGLLPTALYAHPACLLHAAPVGRLHHIMSASEKRNAFGQPENADRIRTMLAPFGTLRASRFEELSWREAPKAAMVDVLRVHEYDYVRQLGQKCDELGALSAMNPNQPAIGGLDPDTEMNQFSREAAFRGAGAATAAVDAVCKRGDSRTARNAFCAIRPPGHHAGPRGAVGGQSAGFCFLSNAAIGAAYALSCHRDIVKRVAVIDFDVHHGNGTEACVRNVLPSRATENVPTAAGVSLTIERSEYKPWLHDDDGDNIFFASIHGFGRDPPAPSYYDDEFESAAGGAFYPGSGGPGTEQARPAVLNSPMPLRTPSASWRAKMLAHVLEPLDGFEPDLIVISAGFDAHVDDPIEAGSLRDVDFAWMTSELVVMAEQHCDGRLVSLLEGGYRITGRCVASLGRAAAEHVAELMRPSLVGAPWDAHAARARLQRTIDGEAEWRAQRNAAAAPALAAGAAAAAVQPSEGSGRRSKRSRSEVDYTALEAQLAKEEADKGADS